jgi:para-aminobenzoate synthetase/4-amino-4-deoxychorismate lyase
MTNPAFLADPAQPFALFDDSLTPSRQARSVLLHDLEERIVCHAAAHIDAVLRRIEAAAASGRHVSIVVDYELGYWLEPKAWRAASYASETPLLTACVFRQAETLDGDDVTAMLAAYAATLPASRRICGIADVRPMLDEVAYLSAVERILAYIADGDCYQVDFTFPLAFRHFGDPLALYALLRRAQPVRHGAIVREPDRTLLSLSPELFVQRNGSRLTTRPMKGTAPRGNDTQSDAANRAALAASEKNRAENLMIVDLIRNDLGRLARIGSVEVEDLFTVEAYPTVWQMTSTISADAPEASLGAVFHALFPCGSVTGAPKVRAMQIAAELEPVPRAVYTGAIGYLQPDGDFSFNVPIRTLTLAPDGSGSLGVGSGIVADSEPAGELAECLLKANFATNLPADFQLIETLLLNYADARLFPMLDEHLLRLAASARYFYFKFDAERIRCALLEHAGLHGQEAARRRTRVLLHKRGEIEIGSTPLPETTDAALPKVVMAELRIDSRDLFRYHKTTVRAEYEAELTRLRAIPEVFDALFCNERGELCEGARSNLYLSFSGVLHTPPVSAGLLDGVMRRHLLREQKAPIVERTLMPDELLRADAIFISNAVRGLQRVELLSQLPIAPVSAPSSGMISVGS